MVRPLGPTQPAQMNQGGRPQQSQDGFKPFTPPNSGNNQVHQMPQTQPRTYEQQGTPQPENRSAQPQENRSTQPANREFRPPQSEQTRPPVQETHPLVRPTPPVQERSPQQEHSQRRWPEFSRQGFAAMHVIPSDAALFKMLAQAGLVEPRPLFLSLQYKVFLARFEPGAAR